MDLVLILSAFVFVVYSSAIVRTGSSIFSCDFGEVVAHENRAEQLFILIYLSIR